MSGKSILAHYFPYDVKLRLLAHSQSFLANQKARNAIVGAENLLLNTNSQTTEITDPLEVFDSFSVFVEPISYQRIFHLVSVLYITPHLVKY